MVQLYELYIERVLSLHYITLALTASTMSTVSNGEVVIDDTDVSV
jgi:hypothetical protein